MPNDTETGDVHRRSAGLGLRPAQRRIDCTSYYLDLAPTQKHEQSLSVKITNH